MVNSIIEEIKKGLIGDAQKDIAYLQQQSLKYKDHPDAGEILKVLGDMSFDLLPEESQRQFKEVMCVDGKRIDQVYGDAAELIKKNDLDGAEELLKKLELQMDKHFSSECNFSFRNRLEEHIYMHIYSPDRKYLRTPFDFCQYLSAYGYLLVEKHKPQEAVGKLEKAIKYNPVNVEPRFELAEVYKLMHEPEKLLECIRETLKIAITPYHISRCYANLGYYCIEIKDYDSAVAFYFESLIYAQNPAVQGELQHIRALTGKTIAPPTREEVLDVFKKYDIKNGPDQDLINLIYSLGSYCMEHNAPPQESLYYMQLAYDLSHSEKLLDTIDMLKAQIAAQNARVQK